MSSALSVSPLLLHDTGVSPTRSRRQFSAAYKLQILTAADACTKPGELGAVLRREGWSSSHRSMWRAAQRRGALQGAATRRGPAPSAVDPSRQQIVELERALAKATARAARAELMIDAQKKFSQLLGLIRPPHDVPTETP